MSKVKRRNCGHALPVKPFGDPATAACFQRQSGPEWHELQNQAPAPKQRVPSLSGLIEKVATFKDENLIGIGITRGTNRVRLIGRRKALVMAVTNNRTPNRFSGLLAGLTI